MADRQVQKSYSGISSLLPDDGCWLLRHIRICPGGQDVISWRGLTPSLMFAQPASSAAEKTMAEIPAVFCRNKRNALFRVFIINLAILLSSLGFYFVVRVGALNLVATPADGSRARRSALLAGDTLRYGAILFDIFAHFHIDHRALGVA